jgi:hypothetical protein
MINLINILILVLFKCILFVRQPARYSIGLARFEFELDNVETRSLL